MYFPSRLSSFDSDWFAPVPRPPDRCRGRVLAEMRLEDCKRVLAEMRLEDCMRELCACSSRPAYRNSTVAGSHL
jgi:hypothetical protein